MPRIYPTVLCLTVAVAGLLGGGHPTRTPPAGSGIPRADAAIGSMPLLFVENRGQIDIGVDPAGNAYLTGVAGSSQTAGFPVTLGPDLTHNGGGDDTLVAKLDPAGPTLTPEPSPTPTPTPTPTPHPAWLPWLAREAFWEAREP